MLLGRDNILQRPDTFLILGMGLHKSRVVYLFSKEAPDRAISVTLNFKKQPPWSLNHSNP